MEGNGDDGIEKRKGDYLAAAPAAGNETNATSAAAAAGHVTTATSTASESEIMAIDAANASTGVNPQSAAAAHNIVAATQLFVANQNWDELETYLAEFLTKVQGEKFYPHPGIFCSLYQAQISHLIGKEQFVEARAVFDDKVKPLLDDQDKDDIYKPFDLEARVEMLQNCVNNCLPPPADETEDMNIVLSDYFMLYFPSSMQSEVKRTNSISDFVTTFNDEKGKHHRCLACQWVMPASATSQSIVYHIKHLKQVNRCRRVTKWMLEHLTGEKEIGVQDMTASSGIHSRKRKAPSPPPLTVSDLDRKQSAAISKELAFQISLDLSLANCEALYALKKHQSAAAVKARQILFRQDKLITELKRVFFNEHDPLGSPMAFTKVKTVLDLSDDLLPLLKNLPDVSELLLEQDKKATELRRCFMYAAAQRPPSNSTC